MESDLSFPVLGRLLRVRGASPALARWLAEQWHFPEHRLPRHPHEIELRMIPAPAVRRPPHRGPTTLVGDLVAEGRGGAWEAADGSFRVRVRRTARGSRVLAQGVEDAPEGRGYRALHLALVHALWSSGLVPLHAAFIAREGRLTALLGWSGTGKSTTVLRVARAGWSPVAEDMGWLEPHSLRVFGWDRALRLWPGALERFAPDLAPGPWSTDPRGKLLLPLDSLGGPLVRAGVLARIVLLARDGDGPSGREPLAPREAVRALWEATGVPLHARDRARMGEWIARLVSRLEARRLRLGSDPLPL